MPEQRIQATLVPARDHATPGERLPFFVENRGCAPICFSYEYALDREDGDRWTNVNVEKYFPQPSIRVEPGGHFQRIAVIPDDARLGRYRISMHVSAGETRAVTAVDIEVCRNTPIAATTLEPAACPPSRTRPSAATTIASVEGATTPSPLTTAETTAKASETEEQPEKPTGPCDEDADPAVLLRCQRDPLMS